MKVGIVEEDGRGLYAYTDISVRGPTGREVNVSALVDTGFNAYISLPSNIVSFLALQPLGTDDVVLANATIDTSFMFVGQVNWRQTTENVPVHEIGDEPAIGTALLRSFNLSIDFVPGGDVVVELL